MKCIQSGNLFTVDRERAYIKIKEDMVSEVGGWLREVLANACDAQVLIKNTATPIQIRLEQQNERTLLDIEDEGIGLDDHHIEALHFMGRTTKSKEDVQGVRTQIGQFGLGFVSVCAKQNGLQQVDFYTRTQDGTARHIRMLNKSDRKVPDWREFEVVPDDPIPTESGTCFRFELDTSQYKVIQNQVLRFCSKTIIPVRFNGEYFCHTPRQILGVEAEGLLAEAQDDENGIEVYLAESRSHSRGDEAIAYLRRMPAESGSAQDLFGIGGHKFALRAYGRPYLEDENIMAVSMVGEPTLARDKMVRNHDFEKILTVVNLARAKAVAHLIKNRPEDKVENLFLANLYTLCSHLAAYLDGRDVREDLRLAVEAVAAHRFFKVFGSTTKLSLNELYRMRATHAVYLYADGMDMASQFSHTSPVTLCEEEYGFKAVFGFWRKTLCESLLRDIFNSIQAEPKPSLYSMEQVVRNQTLGAELEKKGVITRTDFKVKTVEIDDPSMQEWFDALRTTLNQSWFRKALSEYDEIRKIRLVPVAVEDDSPVGGELLALQLTLSDAETDEYGIGIRISSHAARTMARSGISRENLFPAIVQVASCISKDHFVRYYLDDEKQATQIAYTRELLIDMYGLEDRVIHRALRYLRGEKEKENIESTCVVL